MSEPVAVYLPESSAAYERWVSQHPHSYIINAHKTGAVPMYWHRADCGHIQPDGSTQFVGGDYIKVCALDPGPLAEWAKKRQEGLNNCKSCRWKWVKEHSAMTPA